MECLALNRILAITLPTQDSGKFVEGGERLQETEVEKHSCKTQSSVLAMADVLKDPQQMRLHAQDLHGLEPFSSLSCTRKGSGNPSPLQRTIDK